MNTWVDNYGRRWESQTICPYPIIVTLLTHGEQVGFAASKMSVVLIGALETFGDERCQLRMST